MDEKGWRRRVRRGERMNDGEGGVGWRGERMNDGEEDGGERG